MRPLSACGPRTPSFFSREGDSTSAAGLKCEAVIPDRSPTSPSLSMTGKRVTMVLSFSMICFPKADRAHAAFGLGKTQHMQTIIQVADRHVTRFRIRFAFALPEDSRIEIKIGRSIKTQAALRDMSAVLDRVITDLHVSKLQEQKNKKSKMPRRRLSGIARSKCRSASACRTASSWECSGSRRRRRHCRRGGASHLR